MFMLVLYNKKSVDKSFNLLNDIMLVFYMRICGFKVRDSCEFVLDLPSVSLFNDFRKEANEKTREFSMLAQMGKKMGCNL